jgi:hypothetical protein
MNVLPETDIKLAASDVRMSILARKRVLSQLKGSA